MNAKNDLLLLCLKRLREASFRPPTVVLGCDDGAFIDFRLLRSFPKESRVFLDATKDAVSRLDFDCVCDIPCGITPFVANFSFLTGVPMVSPRPRRRGCVDYKDIDGLFSYGDRVLLFNDTLSSGKNTGRYIKILRQNGLVVTDFFVFLDLNRGGRAVLDSLGVSVTTLFTSEGC